MILMSLLQAAATWRIFQRMGNPGWMGLIPLYSTFVMFRTLYGSGWKMLLQLIPIYGLYVSIKLYIDLAHNFNLSTGFGWGLVLLNPIFHCLLGFGNTAYLDGSVSIVSDDVISKALDGIANDHTEKADIMELLADLAQLHQDGTLTDEEFQQLKDRLLPQI